MQSNWNKEELYEREIRPLLDQVWEICRANDLAWYGAICVGRAEEQVTIATSRVMQVPDLPDLFKEVAQVFQAGKGEAGENELTEAEANAFFAVLHNLFSDLARPENTPDGKTLN
jgi:hypothetical protein